MNDPHDPLEQWTTRQLHALPLRRAPANLQLKIWRELQRRALPWWHQSFLYWPLAARMLWMVACLGLASATVDLLGHVDPSTAKALFNPSFSWAENFAATVQALQSFVGLLLRHAPTTWLVGGLMSVGVLYATLLLLGTAMYRSLQFHR